MPKLRMSERERRCKAMQKAVARIMIDRGMKYKKDVARAAGITEVRYNTISHGGFANMRYEEFCKLAALGMTGQEVCEVVGRPYQEASD